MLACGITGREIVIYQVKCLESSAVDVNILQFREYSVRSIVSVVMYIGVLVWIFR